MNDESPQPTTPPGQKKIRLTRSEANAMRIVSSPQKRMTYGAIGLVIAAAFGSLLWHFQDHWLPYWLPTSTSIVEEAEAPAEELIAEIAPPPPILAPPTVELPAPQTGFDFLTATAWDHPEFLHAVRLYNQAFDRYRELPRANVSAAQTSPIENSAIQAAMMFQKLIAQAPSTVPLSDYTQQARRLAQAARELAQPTPTALQSAARPAPATPPPTPRPAPPTLKPGEPWSDPDFLEAARLFNRALEQYHTFLADKSRRSMLQSIEETAFAAAKKFESLKDRAPSTIPIGDNITQCYRLISDCRRQDLDGNSTDTPSGARGNVVGPNRRPALPAYQPSP